MSQVAAIVLGLEASLLAAAVLLGPALALRRPQRVRGSALPALALHGAQRAALDRDRAVGLLGAAEHREAGLELDRRLLAAAELGDAAPMAAAAPLRALPTTLLLASAFCGALALYAIDGHPDLPSQPLEPRIAASRARQLSDDRLVAMLRDALSRQDPAAPETRQGTLLLAQAEAARGHWAAAASAWRTVLSRGFDPLIAVQAAEAQTRADNGVSAQSAALFRRALDASSADAKTGPAAASWRPLAEQRLAEFEHQSDAH